MDGDDDAPAHLVGDVDEGGERQELLDDELVAQLQVDALLVARHRQHPANTVSTSSSLASSSLPMS